MLGKFSRKEKSDGGLDLTGGKGGLLVVSGKLGGFKSDSVEDIVDEGVQDGDTLLGDTSIRVNLFQQRLDVGRVGFNSLLDEETSWRSLQLSFRCFGHCYFLNQLVTMVLGVVPSFIRRRIIHHRSTFENHVRVGVFFGGEV